MKTSDTYIALLVLPIRTANAVTHNYNTSALLTHYFGGGGLNTDRSLTVVFKSVQFFFTSSCAKFHVQTSGWTEGFKQVHRH